MVSLERARGFFYENDPSHDHEILVDDAHISCEEDNKIQFRTIPTTWAIISQIILIILFEILTFVIPAYYCQECATSHTSVVSVLIYSRFILWCLMLIFARYVHCQHSKFRRNGYLDFYLQTHFVRQVPVFAITAGNSILMVAIVLMADYCGESFPMCQAHVYLKPQHYIQMISSLELTISLPAFILYLIKTLQFNKRALGPDVEQNESVINFLYGQVPSTDIGFRDEDRLDDVLEKQADLIRYLREHNAKLGRKIIDLNSELKICKMRNLAEA
uniref:Transmembrane protein 192 n=1 Tax=Strigamia maritima TaxID=126957 RepID=T1J9J8_STRMM